MNLLLLNQTQFESDTQAMADPRQSQHVNEVLQLVPGDRIQVGLRDGNLGEGVIESVGERVTIGNIVLDITPPPQLQLTLVLAMPRPQMLKRILQTVASMGVKKLCLIQSSRVEKGFWQSPSASAKAIEHHLILGLEQGQATQMPIVEKYTRFRPFVEDILDELADGSTRHVAHPGGKCTPTASPIDTPITLAIGPEGGFLEKEVASFCERGFISLNLGRRILKVETVVPVLLAKLYETNI